MIAELRAARCKSKTLVYMDSEMWFAPYVDEYDQKGNLWYNHVWWLATRDRPVPDAKVAIYPFKRSFTVGSDATDVQAGIATMCYLPGAETPKHECWYIRHGRGGQGLLHHGCDGARGELLAVGCQKPVSAIGAASSRSRQFFVLNLRIMEIC